MVSGKINLGIREGSLFKCLSDGYGLPRGKNQLSFHLTYSLAAAQPVRISLIKFGGIRLCSHQLTQGCLDS